MFTSDQLTTFTHALAADRGHLGLVVVAHDGAAPAFPAPADRAEVIALREDTDPESVLDRIASCAREQRWCQLHLLDGALPGRVYGQLRNLATVGRIELAPRGDHGAEVVTWPPTAKVIVVTPRDIEPRITVPTFLNLFGPVLRA